LAVEDTEGNESAQHLGAEVRAHVCRHHYHADALPIGIKRAQRHEEVHVGACQKLAVERAPVLALDNCAQLQRGGLGLRLGRWL